MKRIIGLSKIGFFVFLVLIFMGCGQTTSIDSEQTKSPSVNFITPGVIKSQTTDSYRTSTPISNSIQLTENCLVEKSESEELPQGSIVLKNDRGNLGELNLLILKSDVLVSMGQIPSYGSHVGISPDKTRMAFISVDSQILNIVNAEGIIHQSLSIPTSWISIVEWAQEDKLLIENARFIGTSEAQTHSSSILYDLSSGDYREYLPDYPYKTVSHEAEWGSHFGQSAAYNSMFSSVVYAGQIDTDGYLILWDSQRGELIGQWLTYEEDYQGLPLWMSDGKSFIAGLYPSAIDYKGNVTAVIPDGLPYMGGYDLFRIYQDGEIERLTFLNTKYKSGFEGRSMSPDERFIAFWLNLDYTARALESTRNLAIFDINTGIITNLCLPGGNYPWPPVWSPDGDYLVITISNPLGDSTKVMLVDLDNGIAFQIAQDAIGLGWLASENP